MKLYTFYSETHRELYEIFIKSLNMTNPNISTKVDIFNQTGNGVFMEKGWGDMMSNKLDQIIRACEIGEIFIHSDSDVYFLGNFEERIISELGNYDIAFQDDNPSLCMGFFICNPNVKVTEMFKKVKSLLNRFNGHDQNAMNSIISNSGVKYKKLSHLFFSYGQKNKGVWNGEEFDVNKDILVFHANWVVGTENKKRIIEYVANKIEQ